MRHAREPAAGARGWFVAGARALLGEVPARRYRSYTVDPAVRQGTAPPSHAA